jgi:cell division protein FtsL
MTKPTADVEAAPRTTERRYVYNGEPLTGKHDGAASPNRPVRRRRRSSFNIIVALVTVSVLIVFYVWNKITVNRLVVEVSELQNQNLKLQNANESLRAEINRKSSLERIGKIATGQVGLVYPKEQPVWFTVDSEQLEKLPR